MKLWTPTYSNCFIWAIGMQLMHGGYVTFRKSYFGWWPHAMWSCDGVRWFEYTRPKKTKRFPPPLFRGEVQLVQRVQL